MIRVGAAVGTVVALVLGVMATLTTGAEGAVGWSPAVAVTPAYAGARQASVGLADDAEAAVTWSDNTDAHLATRTPAGVWTSTLLPGGAYQDPELAMNKRGDTVVAWQAGNQSMYLAYRPAGATSTLHITAPDINQLGFTAATDTYPSVSINDTGDALVTWMGFGPDGDIYARRYRSATGAWDDTVQIGSGALQILSSPGTPFAVGAIDDTGRASVIWTEAYGHVTVYEDTTFPSVESDLHAIVGSSSSGATPLVWGSPVPVTPEPFHGHADSPTSTPDFTQPAMAADPVSGKLTLTFQGNSTGYVPDPDGGHGPHHYVSTEVFTWTAGTPAVAAVTPSSTGELINAPAAEAAAGWRAVVGTKAVDPDQIIAASVAPTNGALAPPTMLTSDTGSNLGDPTQVAVGDSGQAAAAHAGHLWIGQAGAFGAPADPWGGAPVGADVAVNSCGDAIAAAAFASDRKLHVTSYSSGNAACSGTTPGPPPTTAPPPPPAPLKLTASAIKLKNARTLSVKLSTSSPTSVSVKVLKGKKVEATGKAKRITSKAKAVSIKLSKPLGTGSYSVVITAKTAAGASVVVKKKLKVT